MDQYRQMLLAARERITEIQPGDVTIDDTDGVIIDVREPHELALGMLPAATAIPMNDLPSRIGTTAKGTDTPILLYCAVGERSAIAAATLLDHGYTNVTSLAGGIKQWMVAGYPTVANTSLTAEQRHRYARHIVLPGIGTKGQQRLLDSKAAIIGAGGLGSPAALYLAAAGIGTLGIVDYDRVELSNLQRQVLHSTKDAGRSKTASAADRINEINSEVTVIAHDARLAADNAIEILSGYDVIIDGTDNFATRYLINDASLHLRVPVVHGSIFRFEGQVSVFNPYDGPCYRCLFPEPPPSDLAPNCAEAGVFGVLPGVIGSMQATEALKLLLGLGTPLIGKLLTYDGLEQTTYTLSIRRDPLCPSCGDQEHPPPLRDENEYC
ncbi:MAG: molybdopterin-synthase adenylyltransferase MoeB [Actinomycetota bacterium]|nr:molybdopterin-synthase adenylyltransferase MoeB [Actinomycetota bacterium]